MPRCAHTFSAYRLRRDALNVERLAEARFVNKVHLEDTAAELSQSNAWLSSKSESIRSVLQSRVLAVDDPTTADDESSELHKTLALSAAQRMETATNVFSKLERNGILVKQAQQEAARLKTANHEASLDQARENYEHQDGVQVRHGEGRLAVDRLMSSQDQRIADAFTQVSAVEGVRVDRYRIRSSWVDHTPPCKLHNVHVRRTLQGRARGLSAPSKLSVHP